MLEGSHKVCAIRRAELSSSPLMARRPFIQPQVLWRGRVGYIEFMESRFQGGLPRSSIA